MRSRKPVEHDVGVNITPEGKAVRNAWITCINMYYEMRRSHYRYTPNPAHDGGYDTRTRRTYRKPVWNTIADRLREEDMAAVHVVGPLFHRWTGSKTPSPLDVLAIDHLNLCRSLIADYPRRIGIAQTTELHCLAREKDRFFVVHPLASDELMIDALVTDTCSGLSPLHRFALAHKARRKKAAMAVVEDALTQYNEAPNMYPEIWTSILSPEVIASLVSFSEKGVI